MSCCQQSPDRLRDESLGMEAGSQHPTVIVTVPFRIHAAEVSTDVTVPMVTLYKLWSRTVSEQELQSEAPPVRNFCSVKAGNGEALGS